MIAAVPRTRPTAGEVSRALLYTLVLAAVAETVLVRVVYRVGIHIPRSGAFLAFYDKTTDVGLYAFNLAALLAIIVLVVRPLLTTTTGVRGQLLPAASLALAIVAILTLVRPDDDLLRLMFLVLVDAVLSLVASVLVQRASRLRERFAIGLILAAVVSFQYYALGLSTISALGLRAGLPHAGDALRLTEALALAAGLATYWAWGPRPVAGERAWLAVGGFCGALFLAVEIANPATTSILALWAIGFTLALPTWAYTIALAGFAGTIGLRLRQPATRLFALGLVLLLVAGIEPGTTYQYILLVIALGLLAQAMDERKIAREPSS